MGEWGTDVGGENPLLQLLLFPRSSDLMLMFKKKVEVHLSKKKKMRKVLAICLATAISLTKIFCLFLFVICATAGARGVGVAVPYIGPSCCSEPSSELSSQVNARGVSKKIITAREM